jgi:MSHA biogenesis protein MshJ
MKKQWEQFAGKINALSLRERGFVFFVLTVGLLLLANTFIFDSLLRQQKQTTDKIKLDQLQIAAIKVEIEQRQAGHAVDLNADTKRRIENGKVTLSVIDRQLTTLHENLVKPEKMDTLLQSILKRNKSLQLISLKSYPVVDLMENSRTSEATPTGTANIKADGNSTVANSEFEKGIYKHEVQLVLQGNYLDMLNYMEQLEAMPERVYWTSSSLKVIEYPKASLSLNLFTLSLEKKWLNL